jgi:hypothetical protein
MMIHLNICIYEYYIIYIIYMSILIISVVVLVFTLVCYGLYELFKTSTITTTPGPGSHPPGPGPPPTPPTPPTPPSYDDICKESDPTKCCGSSKKCQQSEDACQCLTGQSYDCKQNKCFDNYICPNGVASMTKIPSGKVYRTIKCAKCDNAYTLINDKCVPNCGLNVDTGVWKHGTCKGVTNMWETNVHTESSNCCKCGDMFKCCGHECGGGNSGCKGDDNCR